MFKDIKRIISLLNYKQIQRAKYLLVLMICMGIFELISIISIFPLISLISNPNIVYEKPALFFIYNLLSFNSLKDL